MTDAEYIEVIECHAEGEVGDVIVAGVNPPPGKTLWEQSRFVASDDQLRRFMLNEPRGGVFRHCNLLVPPLHPDADAAFIIMEPADTPPMSGSNAICVSTVLLESGLLEMREPETELVLEAPGGLIHVTADCRNGKAESVTLRNVPSFAAQLDARIEVPNIGELIVDTAYGGDSFVVVDAEALGLQLIPDEARNLAELGVSIADAASAQLGFEHPLNQEWRHIAFCLFAHPVERQDSVLHTRHAVAIRPGKIDRSPTGTGVSARLAILAARGEIRPGETLIARSIIDSEFRGQIDTEVTIGNVPGIVPRISGRAWITGRRQLLQNCGDPWPTGYRISDTWPAPRD